MHQQFGNNDEVDESQDGTIGHSVSPINAFLSIIVYIAGHATDTQTVKEQRRRDGARVSRQHSRTFCERNKRIFIQSMCMLQKVSVIWSDEENEDVKAAGQTEKVPPALSPTLPAAQIPVHTRLSIEESLFDDENGDVQHKCASNESIAVMVEMDPMAASTPRGCHLQQQPKTGESDDDISPVEESHDGTLNHSVSPMNAFSFCHSVRRVFAGHATHNV